MKSPSLLRIALSILSPPAGALLLCVSSSAEPVTRVAPSVANAAPLNLAQFGPGPILICSPSQAADFTLPKGNGRLESAGEGAGRATRAVWNTPELGHAQLEAVVGALGFAAAPFAAIYGAVDSTAQRLPPDKVAEAEGELAQTMVAAASQTDLSRFLFEAAAEKTRRQLIFETPGHAMRVLAGRTVIAVLQPQVENLALTPDRKHKNQLFLQINARAKLFRSSDGAVLFDRSYHFQSEPGLFVDWTRRGGLDAVAQTAYRRLATQMAGDVFQPLSEPTIVLPRNSNAPGFTDLRLSSAQRSRPEARSGLQLVSYAEPAGGTMEVYPNRSGQGPVITGVEPEEAAGTELPSNTEWALGGLENDRNAIVQFVSCLGAVPLGLWENTVGAAREHSRGKIGHTSGALDAIVRQLHVEQTIAEQLTEQLRPQPAERPRKPGRNDDAPPGTAAGYKQAVEVQVLNTALTGKRELSRSRSLSVATQATVYRTADGQELYRCPVQYNSPERKLAEWAAQDGELLREELDKCCRQTAEALAAALISRGFVIPKQMTPPLAANR